MDPFTYHDGILHAEAVALPSIAAEVGTPVYVYSARAFETQYQLFADGLGELDHRICFAMKANSNQAILTLLGRLGAGVDVVSGGEYARAKAAGIPGERIVFSGVGKTPAEMRRALEGGVRQINLESEPEMHALSEVASAMDVQVPVTIRVNPDVDAKTHAKIATGKKENKFGIPIAHAREAYDDAARLPGLEVVGIDVHIGSQLTDLAPFRAAYQIVAELTHALRADGHNITRLDLGGGLGIDYTRSNQPPPDARAYCDMIKETVGDLGCEIEIEPGRFIAGNAGLLLSQVIYRKTGEGRDFLILDAAMNDLIRPAMYDSYHEIVPVVAAALGAPRQPYDVVGPVCESGDTFAVARPMPALASGDLVAFRSAGAYSAVMASEYNTRPLVPEVLVRDDQFAVIRPRPTIDELINRDIVPTWV